jgi:Protein kinase domain
MKLRGPLSEEDVRFVFAQVLMMLKRLHSHYHLVHRNLHLRHLWVLKSGYLVLGNLALCRPLEEGTWEKLNGAFGQYPFVAPEVLAPEEENPHYDHLVDLFPLGVILFALLTAQVGRAVGVCVWAEVVSVGVRQSVSHFVRLSARGSFFHVLLRPYHYRSPSLCLRVSVMLCLYVSCARALEIGICCVYVYDTPHHL